MKYTEHVAECEQKLGKGWEVVHRWLDEYAGRHAGPFHWHWMYRHHLEGIEEVRKMWGDQAAEAARLHILSDMGEVYSEARLEELITTHNLRVKAKKE